MMPCKNIRAALDDWLDDRADAQVLAEIDAHLAECDECARFFRYHRELAGDLLALAGAANHIADAPATVARPRRRRFRTIGTVAAAIFLVIGASLYMAQFNREDVVPSRPVHRMAELPPAFHMKVPEKKSIIRLAPVRTSPMM